LFGNDLRKTEEGILHDHATNPWHKCDNQETSPKQPELKIQAI